MRRPARASGYAAREKARPTDAIVDIGERRLRLDKVDKTGSVTLRYRGWLHHIGTGAEGRRACRQIRRADRRATEDRHIGQAPRRA